MKKAFCASMDSNEQRMRRLQYRHRKMRLVNAPDWWGDKTQDGECAELVNT